MSCTRMRRSIERWIDGELPVEERWRVEDHTAECEGCGRYAAHLRRLEGSFEETADPPVSSEDLERAVQGVRARLAVAPQGSGRSESRTWRLVASLSAAAAALVVGVGVWQFREQRFLSQSVNVDPAPAPVTVAIAAEPDAPAIIEASTAEPIEPAEPIAPPAEERLAAVLANHGAHSNDAFLAALIEIRSSRSRVRLIEDALGSLDPEVVHGAARALGLENDLISLRPLERALHAAEDEAAFTAVGKALASYGTRGAAVLGRALGDVDGNERAFVLDALVSVGDETAARVLAEDWTTRLERGDPAEDGLAALLDVHAVEEVFGVFASLDVGVAHDAGLSALRSAPAARARFALWLEGQEDVEPALWRYAELVELAGTRGWLVKRVEDRSTRRRALRCLERWSPENSLLAWFELVDRGVGDEDLERGFERSLAEDPSAGVLLVERIVVPMANTSDVRQLVERLLEVGNASAGPALRALLLRSGFLEEGVARWVALALAEVGDAELGALLAEDLQERLELDRFARAATWIAVERTAGVDALEPLLTDLSDRERARVLRALDTPNTAGLARIARVLDRTFETIAKNQTP